jgi:lipid-binding SYLF domain-containing protein
LYFFIGAAVGGVGREAFGAASLTTKGKEQVNGGNDNEFKVAPIAAYAKSQGLYFGVSLEGSKIFVREDINHRTYQFSTGRECTTDEILSGIVPPPREAEDLYSTLHK